MARGGVVAGGVVVVAAAAAVWFLVGGPAAPEPVVEGEVDAADDAAAAAATLAGGRRPAAADVAAVPGYTATIRGQVTGPAGAPVPGVLVLLRLDGRAEDRSGGVEPAKRGMVETDRLRQLVAAIDDPKVVDDATALRATTGADGRFTVTVDAPGNWSAEARPAPPLCGARGFVWLRREATEGTIAIVLATGAALKGRVLDDKDQPLAAVVSGSWTAAEKTGAIAPAATDPATGAFDLPAVPAGRASLTVRVAGRGEWIVRTPVPPPDPFVIRVPAGGTVVGRVNDPAGAPLADVDVLVTSGPREPTPTGVFSAQGRGKTAADGSFRVGGLAAGRVSRVVMLAPGRPAKVENVGYARWTGAEVRDGAETRLDLVLGRGGVVAGRVLEAGTNAPVLEAEVYLFAGRTAGASEAVRVRVDERGAYRIEDVPFGRYAVMPTSPRHYFEPAVMRPDLVWDGSGSVADAPVVIVSAEGEVVERDLVVTPGLVVRGVVKGPGGAPVAGAEVRAANTAPLYQAAWNWNVNVTLGNQPLATSDVDGTFAVENLPPSSELTFYASKPPLVGEASDRVKLEAGAPPPAPLTLTLAVGATVLGRVVDADGKPVAGRSVNWQSEDPKAPGWGNVTTDDEGKFRAEGLPAAVVRFNTWGSGGRQGPSTAKTDPALKAGEVRDGIELRIARMSYLRGVAVDDTGKPAAYATLFAQGPGAQQAFTTADDGTFDVAVPEGTYQVGSRQSGGWGVEGAAVGAKAPADGLRIVVAPREKSFTIVGGRVVAADGSPVPMCMVQVVLPDGNVVRTDEVVGGEFRREVDRKPPFTLVAHAPRGSRGEGLNLKSNKVTVEKDATDLVLTLETGLQLKGRVLTPAGEPASGVVVQVGASTATSDAAGAFTVGGLENAEPVPLQVRTSAKYVAPQGVTGRPGGEEVVVRLLPSGFVAGRVVGLDDVKGVQAWVYVQSGAGRAAQVGADGAFRIEGLPAEGSVDLGVNTWSQTSGNAGSPFIPATFTGVRIGTDDLVITLTRGVHIRGVVVDADGVPVGGNWINATSSEAGVQGVGGQVAQDGTFTLGAVRPGTFTVNVNGPNGGVLTKGLKVEAPAENVRIVLPRMHRVAGRVVGGSGKPMWVALYPKGGKIAEQVGGAQVGADGRFALDVAGDGPFTANVMADDRYGRAEHVVPGTEVEIQLAMGLEISGVVEPEARATGGTYVMAEGELWQGGASCDATGAFKLKGLPPGRYVLKVYSQEAWKDPGTGTPADAGATNVRLR